MRVIILCITLEIVFRLLVEIREVMLNLTRNEMLITSMSYDEPEDQVCVLDSGLLAFDDF